MPFYALGTLFSWCHFYSHSKLVSFNQLLLFFHVCVHTYVCKCHILHAEIRRKPEVLVLSFHLVWDQVSYSLLHTSDLMAYGHLERLMPPPLLSLWEPGIIDASASGRMCSLESESSPPTLFLSPIWDNIEYLGSEMDISIIINPFGHFPTFISVSF